MLCPTQCRIKVVSNIMIHLTNENVWSFYIGSQVYLRLLLDDYILV